MGSEKLRGAPLCLLVVGTLKLISGLSYSRKIYGVDQVTHAATQTADRVRCSATRCTSRSLLTQPPFHLLAAVADLLDRPVHRRLSRGVSSSPRTRPHNSARRPMKRQPPELRTNNPGRSPFVRTARAEPHRPSPSLLVQRARARFARACLLSSSLIVQRARAWRPLIDRKR